MFTQARLTITAGTRTLDNIYLHMPLHLHDCDVTRYINRWLDGARQDVLSVRNAITLRYSVEYDNRTVLGRIR